MRKMFKIRVCGEKKRASMGRFTLVLMMAVVLGPCAAAAEPGQQEQQPLQVNDYRIGPKDLLEITVFELPELNQTVRVSEDGSITLSLLGKVDASKLTAQELESRLASLLDKQFTKGAHVTVFIKEYQKVSVIGAVARSGMYELVGPTTLLQAIAQAGGLTSLAMKEIYIYRQGRDGKQERMVIDLADLVNGKPDLNVELQPKDVVTIPIDQTLNVFVYGEVNTPGVVPYMGSKGMTLLQAIAQAGGTTVWAKRTRIMIKRRDKRTGQELQIEVNMKNIINNKMADILLEEGDVVIVP
jgi:polysaccharide export outer membrane protein